MNPFLARLRSGSMSASLIGHFQGIHPRQCRCRSRARASLWTRHQGPSSMGFEGEVEQSWARPCRRGNGLGGVTETVIKIARWPALGRSRCRHRAATACPAGVGNSRINLRETAYRSYQTDTRRRPPRARTSCLVRQIKNGALRAKARKRSQPFPDRSRINTCAENLKRFGGKAL
jgi:hypothetical protein